MSKHDLIIKELEAGLKLVHELSDGSLDIVIYPACAEEETLLPSASIHIGGIMGNSLVINFVDNKAAAHFYLGFCGINEVVEM